MTAPRRFSRYDILLPTVNMIVARLTKENLPFAGEWVEDMDNLEEINAWIVGVKDSDGYENVGMVGVDDEGIVAFFACKPDVLNHDLAEGFTEDESECWWKPDTVELFCEFLRGDVRKITRKFIALNVRELDKSS